MGTSLNEQPCWLIILKVEIVVSTILCVRRQNALVLQLMTTQRKPFMVDICSTIRKRAKRTSDTIVETTEMK